MKTIIVWFRNDLRLHDQPALAAACAQADRVVPLFLFDSRLTAGKHASPNRNRFLLEALQDLKDSLQGRSADLVIRQIQKGQSVADMLLQVAEESSADEVFYSIDYTPYARERDSQVTAALGQHTIAMQAFPGRLAVDSFEGVYAKNGNTYKVFTPFWKNWSTLDRRELATTPRAIKLPDGIQVGSLPSLAQLGAGHEAELSPEALTGGETAGHKRMLDFVKDGVQQYGNMHDSLAPDGTSKLSPYLHFGCVSVRQIEHALENHGSGEGAARFHRQLAWRDFYNYILLHFPANSHQEFQERYRTMPWSYDEKLLKAWQAGQTGYPIIDAAMRQLLAEGWMHNRARLIVGSFLTKDLGLDWRLGEQHFMRWLLDGDQANNNGNWQWIASVGVDPAPVFRRLYNPMTQQKRYDEDGSYVRKYVPELAKVADTYLAEPWKMPLAEQQMAGCVIGTDYPAPIVDHASARREALERYRAV